ncbi:MAG: alpha/beta fold hydrolase [Planctomycetes bacterium]|nr:alpha/beta fold hydrolase [Planctomycetota bacterium]
MLALVATLTLVFATQDKGPSAEQQKALLEAYFAASATTPQGLAERKRVLAEFALVPATPAAVAATQKAVQKLWEKGRELDKSNGQAFFWEQEKKGLYIVGGNVKKPKALAICMHGGGAGSGDAWSAQGGYDPALKGLDWLAIYPEVLEKTEHGWTDAGTEEWVLELLECARRTWKIDANKVFLCGHSMGGYGSWTLGAHHADQLAAVAPSAGAPTPYMNREGKFTGVSAGIIPNLRNLPIRIYQSDDDPQVPPEANRVAAQQLKEAKERWGGFDYEYWEVPGRQHTEPPGGYEAHLAKIAKLTRTTHPDTVVWQPTLAWKQQSYWLYWDEPVKEALVVAKADKKTNTVHVTCDKSTRGLYVLVDEKLLDPKKELVVFLGDKELFRGLPQPSLGVVVATGARGDTELAYSARIPLF